jgi:hypothetical protein
MAVVDFLGRADWREWRALIEGCCAQGFGISRTVWCKLVAEACICAEHEVAINGVVVSGSGGGVGSGMEHLVDVLLIGVYSIHAQDPKRLQEGSAHALAPHVIAK